MQVIRRLPVLCLLFFVFFFLVGAPENIADPQGDPARIVAVGDIHGSFDGLIGILQETGLINKNLDWTGGNATLVQTGDMLDRGVEIFEVMDLLISLQGQAPRSGGKVIVLLGNHEAMNMVGFLRDVNPEAMGPFVDRRSEKKRRDAFAQWSRFFAHAPDATDEAKKETEAQWMDEHPPGFVEYAQAFDSKGKYGRWLRKLPVAVQVADSLFMHAGISPQNVDLTIKEINDKAHREIRGFDRAKADLIKMGVVRPFFSDQEIAAIVRTLVEAAAAEGAPSVAIQNKKRLEEIHHFLQGMYETWVLFGAAGPLWFRGYDQWEDEQLNAYIPAWLKGHKARRIVVSHNPQANGEIKIRLENQIYLIDTGMLSSVYKGQASALDIRGKLVTAVYENGKKVDLEPPPAATDLSLSWIVPNGSAICCCVMSRKGDI